MTAAVKAYLDDRQLMEVLSVVSACSWLAMVLNSCALAPEGGEP